MFKVSKNPVIRDVPIALFVSGEDQSFTATFEILPMSRISGPAMETELGQRQLLVDAIKDLGQLEGDNGELLTFGPNVLDAVLDRLDSRTALLTEYMKATQELARGNSNGLPAHGSTAA